MDIFKHTFVINLDYRFDRLLIVNKHLKNLGITFERFPAIRPKFYDIPTNYRENIYHSSGKPSQNYIIGTYGCAMSHIGIIKLAKARNYKYVLILEDDATFIDDFNPELLELPDNWDMLYLGGNHHIEPASSQPNVGIRRIKKTTRTHSYIVRNNLYQKIIDEVVGYPYPIDMYYAREIQPYYNCYCIDITYQRSGFSDIMGRDKGNR